MLPSTAADIPTGDRAEQGSRPWSEPHRRVAVQGAVDQAHPGGVRRTDEYTLVGQRGGGAVLLSDGRRPVGMVTAQQIRPDPAEQPVLMMQDFGAPAE